jgi:hypothetical protein
MDLLPRLLGKDWAERLEFVLFRQENDMKDTWNPEAKDGFLAQKYLGES